MPNRLLFAGILLMGTAAAAASALQGVWSGDRHVLTMDASGARLETDCAFAEFPALTPDSKGHFKVSGRFHPDTAGPQPTDKPATGKPATLEGAMDGGKMQLTLSPEGSPPQTLTLEPGRKVKLIRCL